MPDVAHRGHLGQAIETWIFRLGDFARLCLIGQPDMEYILQSMPESFADCGMSYVVALGDATDLRSEAVRVSHMSQLGNQMFSDAIVSRSVTDAGIARAEAIARSHSRSSPAIKSAIALAATTARPSSTTGAITLVAPPPVSTPDDASRSSCRACVVSLAHVTSDERRGDALVASGTHARRDR
jgi:hypothetical protein